MDEIYYNLPNSLKNSNCILFADDTTIYQSATDITILRSQIENYMVVLNDWFYANKLSLNIQKTHFMMFKPENSRNSIHGINNITLGTQNIQRVNCAKFLGIYIHVDDELEWGDHIDHISKKIASGSYALKTVKRTLSTSNLKLLYHSLIHSHLTHMALHYGDQHTNIDYTN